jgi:hypothetical protein
MHAGRREARHLCDRRAALERRAVLGPTPLPRVQGAPLTTCYSLLTTHYSLLPTTHYSRLPLTSFHSLIHSFTHLPTCRALHSLTHLLRVRGAPRRARAAAWQGGGRARTTAERPVLAAAQPRHRGGLPPRARRGTAHLSAAARRDAADRRRGRDPCLSKHGGAARAQ